MKKLNKITGTAMLIAIVIVLQLLSNYLPAIGTVSITLALIPIAVGACIYGKWTGAILGFVMGIIVLVAPSTISFFFAYSPVATIFTCLFKTSAAGFVSGLVFELLKKKPHLGCTLASIVVPIVNTGIFAIFATLFFKEKIETIMPEGANFAGYLITGFIGVNFLIEFATNVILSVVVYQVYKIVKAKRTIA